VSQSDRCETANQASSFGGRSGAQIEPFTAAPASLARAPSLHEPHARPMYGGARAVSQNERAGRVAQWLWGAN